MTSVLALLVAACPASEGLELSAESQATLCALDERTPPAGTTAATDAALKALYERDVFRSAHQSPASDLLKRLKLLLESLFETSGAETFSNVTRVAVLILAAALVVLVVVRVAGRRFVKPAAPHGQVGSSSLALADPSVHLAKAQALVSTDPRGGAREGLLAMLAALERQRLARPDRVKTNRELALELPSRGAPPDLVREVTAQLEWFDRAFYSLEPLDSTRAKAFLSEAASLVATIEALELREAAA